jgi:hypothetical protein
MSGEYIIYTNHIEFQPDTPDEQRRAIAQRYATLLQRDFEENGLDIKASVRHDVEGVGGGLQDYHDESDWIEELAECVFSRGEFWAEPHNPKS